MSEARQSVLSQSQDIFTRAVDRNIIIDAPQRTYCNGDQVYEIFLKLPDETRSLGAVIGCGNAWTVEPESADFEGCSWPGEPEDEEFVSQRAAVQALVRSWMHLLIERENAARKAEWEFSEALFAEAPL